MDKIQILVYFAIYFLGRYKFSLLWMVLFVLISMYGYEKNKRNDSNPMSSMGERDAVLMAIDDVPSWVLFPDVERAEWMNNVLTTLWPRIKDYSERKLRDLQPKINKQPWLRNLKIEQVSLGDVTPRITGIKVHNRNILREEIVVDFHISYSGDFLMTLSMFGFAGGIRNIKIEGAARITMKNFVSKLPFIGGVEFSFLSCPRFDYELLPVFASLNLQMVNSYIRSTVRHQILNHVVFPHKIFLKVKTGSHSVPTSNDEDLLPEIDGIIHVSVSKIKKFIGFDHQRVFVSLELGSQIVESKEVTIESGIATMNFECELIQFTKAKTKMKLDLNIKDENDEITMLRGWADTKHLSKDKTTYEKYRLSPSGRFPMTLTWLELSSKRKDLEAESKKHATLLEVFIDSARRLPQNQRGIFVELSVNHTIQQTWASEEVNPSWRKYFTFFIHHPENESLTIKLTHESSENVTENTCGQFIYNISDLIARKQMRHDLQAFPLQQTIHECEILMSLKLNALKHPS